MTDQILDSDGRVDKKTTVTGHFVQILLPSLLIPANPPVTIGQSPRRRTERQTPYQYIFFTINQISYLRAAQRTAAKVMISIHQLIPDAGFFAFVTTYGFNAFRTHLRQIGLYLFPFSLVFSDIIIMLDLRRLGISSGQCDYTLTVQSQQRNPTTHLLKSAVGAAPLKPLTNSKRKLSS